VRPWNPTAEQLCRRFLMHRKIQIACASLCAALLGFTLHAARAQQQGNTAAPNPLVQLLESKGILTAADVAASSRQARPKPPTRNSPTSFCSAASSRKLSMTS
jgi:hypothetical protein